MPLTAPEITRELGELPDHVVAVIEKMGVSRAQLVEARARLGGQEPVDRVPPSPVVERLMRLMDLVEGPEEESLA